MCPPMHKARPVAKNLHNGLSSDDRLLMGKPSLLPGYCVICGDTNIEKPPHHVVYRSRGGRDGPLWDVCRPHHRMIHDGKIKPRWKGFWAWATGNSCFPCHGQGEQS
jgi:hypothetical protein